ncbi:TPA: hypothetical protein ACWMB3_000733 [Enterococcus faecium]|nr:MULTISPECIES: hypothetical protein [Enterococcus]EFF37456.1 LacG, putative [Enterococcus faecium E980]EGP5572799.1 hypothetical protein [Enterococcus faecium]ELB36332.1 hypothetical protein OK9_03638 [Enterococcus faecium EnGen0033]KST52399.1 hypothetical protein AOY36_05805 [Enterococcus faecium]MBJ7269019.1 hypothetical protein [Enterococcus sp. SS2]
MLFEFYYQRRSKIFYLFLSIILLLSTLMFVSQVMLIQSHLRHFQYYVEEALARGETIQEILEQPFSISMNQNTEIVDNPLKYHYVAYHSSFAALNVQNGVNQLLSSSFFVLFPFFSGVYGIVIANADIKYYTMKIRRCLDSQWQINRHKIGAGFLSLIIFILASLILFLMLQSFSRFFVQADKSTQIDEALIRQISYLEKAPLQLSVLLGFAFLSFLVCYYFTTVVKNSFVSLCLLGSYFLFLPPLGKYDLKNILLYLYPKIFNTNASTFRINSGTRVEFGIEYIVIIGIGIIIYIWTMEKLQRMWSSPTEK